MESLQYTQGQLTEEQGVFELDMLSLLSVWLLHWKKIMAVGILLGVAALLFSVMTFDAPAENASVYRQIEQAIASRSSTEEMLYSARQSYEENQFYSMDVGKLCTKRLTIIVEINDPGQVTDQLDPTDVILYAYHNLARTQLNGEVLVPDILTKLQQEQLLGESYNTEMNTLNVSITSDDEELIDTVLAVAAQWYLEQSDEVTEQTQLHKLTILPVSETKYSREAAEEMISPLEAEANIRELENQIAEYDAELEQLFKKPADWAVSLNVDELEDMLAEKKQAESQPNAVSSLLTGWLMGSLLLMFVYAIRTLLNGELFGENGVANMTGWQRMGRLNVIKASKDPIVRCGQRMQYRDLEKDREMLGEEMCAMTALLLEDSGIADGTLALVGDISEEQFRQLTECLQPLGMTIQTSLLCGDRISANQVCRKADAVIFVGRADQVRRREVLELLGILGYLKKQPLGFMLV